MSKRNITYIKPDEPNFLKRLKQQIGYKEGPTVDTKRESLGPAEDLSDPEEEQPTVVVLNEGDLTAEEALREKDRLERDITEGPADLTSRIIFKAPKKTSTQDIKEKESTKAAAPSSSSEGKPDKSSKSKDHKKKTTSKRAVLSFDDEEDD